MWRDLFCTGIQEEPRVHHVGFGCQARLIVRCSQLPLHSCRSTTPAGPDHDLRLPSVWIWNCFWWLYCSRNCKAVNQSIIHNVMWSSSAKQWRKQIDTLISGKLLVSVVHFSTNGASFAWVGAPCLPSYAFKAIPLTFPKVQIINYWIVGPYIHQNHCYYYKQIHP